MMHLLFFTVLVGGAMAGISDLNCTDAGRYAATALNCQNKYPNADCENLFGNPVKVNTDDERPDKCFKNAAAVYNEPMKQLAVSICPLTCGYCCITPAYNCENKRNPRISCATITPDMCENPTWKPIIVEDCPKSCGFCNEGTCVDIAKDCAADISICNHVDMQDFVKKNCKRTCGFCDEASADCGNDAKCTQWIANGFCKSTFYTDEQKKKYCGKPCGLC
ncbi:shTK domain protein [Ancylostoma ceylanicum]|nr:shTK domain protein [Ancylostoma ceylanicum]